MQSESSQSRPSWPRIDAVRRHWSWRPEWHRDRPCLYWYLTFDPDAVAAAIGPEVITMATAPSTSYAQSLTRNGSHIHRLAK